MDDRGCIMIAETGISNGGIFVSTANTIQYIVDKGPQRLTIARDASLPVETRCGLLFKETGMKTLYYRLWWEIVHRWLAKFNYRLVPGVSE